MSTDRPLAEIAGRFPIIAPPSAEPEGRQSSGRHSFAVVVAAYNAAETIAESLESALAQTSPPAQVIVCDDGSTDDTAEVVSRYEPEVTLLRRPHNGAAAARNAALGAATTSHIVCFDADDLLLPDCVAAYEAALAHRPDLAIVTCDAYLELDGVVFDRYYRRRARFAALDQRRAALHQHFVFGFAAVERRAAVAAGGWDDSLVTGWDTDLFLRLILAGAQVGLVHEPLAVYRMRPGSLSDNRARSLREMVRIVDRATRDPTLSGDERAFALVDLAAKERLATAAELEAALANAPAEVRERALAVARAPAGRFSRKARLAAYLAAAFPRATSRAWRARPRRRDTLSVRARARAD